MKRTPAPAALLALLSAALLAPRVLAGTAADEIVYVNQAPSFSVESLPDLNLPPSLTEAITIHLNEEFRTLPGVHLLLTQEHVVLAAAQTHAMAAAWNRAEAATSRPQARRFMWTPAMEQAYQALRTAISVAHPDIQDGVRRTRRALAALYDSAAQGASMEAVRANAPSTPRQAVVQYLDQVLDYGDRPSLLRRRNSMTPETTVLERDLMLHQLKLDTGKPAADAQEPELARRLQASQSAGETTLTPDLVEAIKQILAALSSDKLREIPNPYFRLIAALVAVDRMAKPNVPLELLETTPWVTRMPPADRVHLHSYLSHHSERTEIVPKAGS